MNVSAASLPNLTLGHVLSESEGKMGNRFMCLVLILALAAAQTGTLLTASIILGQETEPNAPAFFKVYSRQARQSLTATCLPIDRDSVVNQVRCKFVHVRFDLPEKQLGKTGNPFSAEEALKDPALAEQFRKNPKQFEQELREAKEKMKQDTCAAMEKEMGDPDIGPKTKRHYQQLLPACAEKDPSVFFRRLPDTEPRMWTCDLWVDQFTLEFRKVKDGQWLYRQESPGLFSKVLKVYELTGDGLHWTLTETRVPTQGAEEKPNQTVWSWKNAKNYELPCDFISHGMIQYP